MAQALFFGDEPVPVGADDPAVLQRDAVEDLR